MRWLNSLPDEQALASGPIAPRSLTPGRLGGLVGLGFVAALVVVFGAIAVVVFDGRRGSVDLATIAADWNNDWTVVGNKTEPTYTYSVEYGRVGDRFFLEGQAFGESWGLVELDVDSAGTVSVEKCPATMRCDRPMPISFMTGAAVLGLARRGELHGEGRAMFYAGHEVVCIPAGSLGVEELVLEPCLDPETGAMLAFRHLKSGLFEGPTLDEYSVEFATGPDAALLRLP